MVEEGRARLDEAFVVSRFLEVFGAGGPMRCFRAPGRVNLIGDHIDYSGGSVLPMALNRGTLLVARPNGVGRLRGFSLNRPAAGVISANLDDTEFRPELDWFAYVVAVVNQLRLARLGLALPFGLDVLVAGDIPDGAGLSSSASLELAAAVAFDAFGGFGLDPSELAVICQRAENEDIGVACGIMDQLAIAEGRRDHAMLMDCATLDVRYVPFPHSQASVIIANSNKRRSLNESAYNDRRRSVEQARESLARPLVDIDPAELAEVRRALGDGPTFSRVRHTITEQQRVLEAAAALEAGDLGALGALMRASHESLRDDFEVTGPELDALVEAAWVQPGTIGARMTGAGFGGCGVILAQPGEEADVIAGTRARYTAATGLAPEFLIVNSDDGAREVDLPGLAPTQEWLE